MSLGYICSLASYKDAIKLAWLHNSYYLWMQVRACPGSKRRKCGLITVFFGVSIVTPIFELITPTPRLYDVFFRYEHKIWLLLRAVFQLVTRTAGISDKHYVGYKQFIGTTAIESQLAQQ